MQTNANPTVSIKVAALWKIPSLSRSAPPLNNERSGFFPCPGSVFRGWPTADAWQAYIALHEFLDRQIEITFWAPPCGSDQARPNRLAARCDSLVAEMIEGYPQPFISVMDYKEVLVPNGYCCLHYLLSDPDTGTTRIRLAEVTEIESARDCQLRLL